MVVDNIGVPQSVNLAFTDSATVGSADGEILVSLNPEKHGPTPAYVETLRARLPEEFPELSFFFQPADIVSQILNFGLPAPIDVRVMGYNQDATYPVAREIEAACPKV